MNGLTGIPDLDIQILLDLDDSSLRQACQTNKYIRFLCSKDMLWHHRILRYLDSRYLQDKHPDLTWRQWYFFWRSHQKDPIGDTLRLNPIQAYIRLITETGIMKGSEMFQSLRVLLPKALASRDDEIVNYFMDRLRSLVEFTQNHPDLKSNRGRYLHYDSAIIQALQSGYLNMVDELLTLMISDLDVTKMEFITEFNNDYVAIRHELQRLEIDNFSESMKTLDQKIHRFLVEGYLRRIRRGFIQGPDDLQAEIRKRLQAPLKQLPPMDSLSEDSKWALQGEYDLSLLQSRLLQQTPELTLDEAWWNLLVVAERSDYFDLYLYLLLTYQRIDPEVTATIVNTPPNYLFDVLQPLLLHQYLSSLPSINNFNIVDMSAFVNPN